MSVIEKILCNLDRQDEALNVELARELACANDIDSIKEVALNLDSKDKRIRHDCIKILYEVGYIKPLLISDYVFDFIKFIKSRDNRMVWGGMIALGTIADIKAKEIYEDVDRIYSSINTGSVITVDNGIKVLGKVAASNDEYNKAIFPYLINHIKTCRPKEVPQHSESIFPAVNSDNKKVYIEVLNKREEDLSAAQLRRVKKLYKDMDKK